ncbi:WD40 repeat-like protein [Exidia glandulosa HHB12029]|uniref:WD40 repeat-like protein n=1 Tax=Exidia glandulosa HHB12029 TaxID=1314781 RepID=A0A165F3F3_EXIGL|nr:WD40 repeat-like protein [Exidia glandulosa HHB12029]
MSKPAALAVVTSGELILLDAKAGAAPLSRTTLAAPTAFVADAANVFVASPHGVAKYGRDSGVHVFGHAADAESIGALCAADDGTVFSAQGNAILVHAPGSAEPTQTLEGHSSSVTSLALSSDRTLLASTSKTVYVHNLTSSSRTILRGLPCPNAFASCATFHPSRPTTLLVAISRQLVVYDVTKPTAPEKVVQIGGTAAGDIVALDCSPFSKSLLAVACAGGLVGIVDMDKEKSLVKTIDMKTTITSLRFQPDAAVVVVGTADGRVLYADLRATDKQPQSIVADKHGRPVIGLAWLKRGKPASSKRAPVATKSTKPTTLQDRTSPRSILKPKARSPIATSTAVKGPQSTFSPAKDSSHPLSKSTATAASRTATLARAAKENAPASRPSPVTRAKTSPPKPSTSKTTISTQPRALAPPAERRPRISSSSQASTRILSSRRVSNATTSSRLSHTPSPSLPSECDLQSSPHRHATEKRREIQALGLGTPGARRRAPVPSPLASPTRQDSNSRNKRLSWADEEEGDGDTVIQPSSSTQDQERVPSACSAAESISTDNVANPNMQLSPTRRPQVPTTDWSPVRAAMNNSPQATLRAFMQELATKDDIKGLHMDLIRMGMAWKSEMRSLMEQYVGDLSSLREENTQLREELQRLRNRC